MSTEYTVYIYIYKYLGPAVQIEIGPVVCCSIAAAQVPTDDMLQLTTIVFIILYSPPDGARLCHLCFMSVRLPSGFYYICILFMFIAEADLYGTIQGKRLFV